jgi:hypothetical protein
MLILLVAVLAAPAMAEVIITVDKETGDPCTVDIKYECTLGDKAGTKAKMAGIALIISVDSGDTIDAVDPCSDGESTAAAPGYGVFMKVAQINMADPCNPVWASPGTANPEATPGSPGEVGGLGENQITVEFGALYEDPCDDGTNAPLASGTLCTLTLSDNETCVTLELEDTARGGIVMEGGADPCGVTLTGKCISPDCFLTTGMGGQAACDNWVYFGKPECWCETRQCHGDVDGLMMGSTKVGYYAVGADDLGILVAAWQLKEPAYSTETGLGTTIHVASGVKLVCADIDHLMMGSTKVGYYAVGADDLGALVSAWQLKEPEYSTETGVPTDCPNLNTYHNIP